MELPEFDLKLTALYDPDQVFENQILTVRDTARLLKCSSKTIYKLVSSGDLPHRRVGGGIRFLLPEVIEWMRGG
jgi:excisionase family DNA binding protein